MCKKGGADEVAGCLGYNPDLLNCLEGAPFRKAVLGRNIPVMEVLMGFKELQINMRGESEFLYVDNKLEFKLSVSKYEY